MLEQPSNGPASSAGVPVRQQNDALDAGSTDLGGGSLSPAELVSSNLGLEEQAHRFRLQLNAFHVAVAASMLLLICACTLAFILMAGYFESRQLDWHASLLIGAFIVPATILMVATLRAAFPKSEPKAEAKGDELLPMLQTAKELKSLLDMLKSKD